MPQHTHNNKRFKMRIIPLLKSVLLVTVAVILFGKPAFADVYRCPTDKNGSEMTTVKKNPQCILLFSDLKESNATEESVQVEAKTVEGATATSRLPSEAESDAQARGLAARHSAFSDATPMPGGGFYLPVDAQRREKVWGRAVPLSFDDMSSADRRFIGQKQQEGTTQEGSDISLLAAGAYEFRNLYDRPLGKLIVRGDAGGENRSYKFVPGKYLEGDTLGDAKDMALWGAARLGSLVTGLTELLGIGGEEAGAVRREFDELSADARADLSLKVRSRVAPPPLDEKTKKILLYIIGAFVLIGIGLPIFIALYFAPSIVALNRNHPNTQAIFVLNLLLGWTFVGWALAFVWGFTNKGI